MSRQRSGEGEAVLIRRRYKVVGVLRVQDGYALLEAVDITQRETPVCLLNCYEGALLSRYAKIYASLSHEDCPAYRGMFLEGETLVAVFDECGGEPIDLLFHRGDRWTWSERLAFAGELLHCALLLTPLPAEVGCAALLSENLLFDASDRSFRVRYMVPPMEEMNARELALLAGDQAKKILPRTLLSTRAEEDFLDTLERGEYGGTVALYAAWREYEPEIRRQREEFSEKGLFGKAWTLARRAVARRKRQEAWV